MICDTITKSLLGALLCVGAASCFTGVESTPRIDASTVREQRAADPVAEASYLVGIKPEAPAKWRVGKRFHVVDDRISLIFGPPSDPTDKLVGQDIIYLGTDGATSLTGNDASVMRFADEHGGKYYYRINNYGRERLDTISSLEVPFTVDLDLVSAVNTKMRGQHYYVRTPAWYSADSSLTPLSGLRHVRIVVDSVVAGTADFPAAVCFHQASGNDKEYVLLMSVGKGRGATRTFDSLFAFDNPRNRYPEIKDDVWELITRSRVREGMTRDECRLALGQPSDILRIPTYGGMQERWTYTDGIYLIFDDGFLTKYRR